MRVQDVLSTKEGRAEVLLNPGSFLRVGENSSIRLASSSLTRPSVEVLSGSVVLEVAAESKDELVTLTWKDVVLSLVKHGVFRLDTDPAGLRVFDGEVSVTSAGHQVTVGKGKMLPFDGTWALAKFDAEQTDSLDRWSGRRASYLAMANPSAAGMPGGYRNSAPLRLVQEWMLERILGLELVLRDDDVHPLQRHLQQLLRLSLLQSA